MISASVELEEAQQEEGVGLRCFCAIRQKTWIPFIAASAGFFAAMEPSYTYSSFPGGDGEPVKVNLSDFTGIQFTVNDLSGSAALFLVPLDDTSPVQYAVAAATFI